MPPDARTVRYPALLPAAVFALALLAPLGALQSYRVAKEMAAASQDPYGVARAVERLSPLRERLPAGARVAYFTDVPVNTEAGTAAFLAAQYALAPCLLVDADATPRPEWAVGNFSKPQDFSRPGYKLAADFGNGAILYRRGDAR